MEKILMFVFAIVAINILVFFAIPNSKVFMFDLDDAIKEPWIFITFQFFHANLTHLVENIIGLVFVGFLSRELSVSFKSFVLVYFVSIFVVPLPLALLFPEATVTGNSMGIFGVLGLALVKGRKLIPQYVSIPMFLFMIFSLTILNFISCGQCYQSFLESDVFHFFGFVVGIIFSMLPAARNKHILTRFITS
jgi:membrane associated rhomboid family serine protease